MNISDIDQVVVASTLTTLFDSDFPNFITDLGYIPQNKVLAQIDPDVIDPRQKAIAFATRRARNYEILNIVFNSPKYKNSCNVLTKIMSGWDKAFMKWFLDKYDFEVTTENVMNAFSALLSSFDSTVFSLAIELPGYIPTTYSKINSEWCVCPPTAELFAGFQQSSHWINGTLHSNLLPSTMALNNSNGFLMRKCGSLTDAMQANTRDPEFLLIQLSPVVVRAYETYTVQVNNVTKETILQPVPQRLSHLRLRIPVSQNYIQKFTDDLSWLLSCKKVVNENPKVRNALERYGISLFFYCSGLGNESAYDDAVHDAVIGLESLLISANSEVNYRFQTILSRLMPEESQYSRPLLKRLYQQRSDVAHDGKTSGKHKATNIDAFQAISLLNAAIRWYLEKASTLTEKEIRDYLVELPFQDGKDVAKSPWGSCSEIGQNPPSETGPWSDSSAIQGLNN